MMTSLLIFMDCTPNRKLSSIPEADELFVHGAKLWARSATKKICLSGETGNKRNVGVLRYQFFATFFDA